ncbi:lasso peptide biosynthesis B2 protein [Leucobacter sp. G161]|uniref:lasso peptide biosynthesis B2 protein n=1 Tax=Leucobacter sp. G161 TaxID=663704 RepID=UPI0009F8625A
MIHHKGEAGEPDWGRLRIMIVVGVSRIIALLPPVQLARFMKQVSRNSAPADVSTALLARQELCLRSKRCASPAGCLQRSVAVVLLCKSVGVVPSWFTGFVSKPFHAHAWVEAEGKPVGERSGVTAFTKIHEAHAGRVRS